MSLKIQDLLNLAASDLGIRASGETLVDEEYNDGLTLFQMLVRSWDVERINIYAVKREQYPLANNVGQYKMGPGATLANGDGAAPRPVAIRAATLIDNGHYTPMAPMSPEEFAALPTRGDTSITPKKYYYDNDYPTASLYVHPLPQGNPTIELYTWEPLLGTAPLTLATEFDLPPAYDRALRLAMAVEYAPTFGNQVQQTVVTALANQAKSVLAKLNLPPTPGMAQEAEAGAEAQQLSVPSPPSPQQ